MAQRLTCKLCPAMETPERNRFCKPGRCTALSVSRFQPRHHAPMLRTVKRRTTTLAMRLGLAAAGLAAAVWLAAPREVRPEPPARLPSAAAPVPRPDAATPPAHTMPAAHVMAAPTTLTTELCGIGRLALRQPGGNEAADAFDGLPDPVGRLALQELQQRLLRTLAAGNGRQRVAAGLMQQPDVADPELQAGWAASLLAEAQASGDAQALRWAAAACSHTGDALRCRRELAQARVQAEPDNGLHWLEWAQETSGEAEQALAWQGLVRAHAWHEHPVGLTAVTQSALAAMRPPPAAYLRARLARETLGRDAAQSPGGLDWLAFLCAQHRSDCAQLAARMEASADSTALLQQAAVLGQQAGWPEARVQALAAATQAFHAQLPSWPEGSEAALSCSGAEPQLAHVEAVSQRGEPARAR